MPPGHSSKHIANDFNQFFIYIIERLKAHFTESTDHGYLDGEKIKQHLTEFQPINIAKTELLILAAPSKTFASDPIATHIVKPVALTLGPIIHKLIKP